jgi:hypothetical protein
MKTGSILLPTRFGKLGNACCCFALMKPHNTHALLMKSTKYYEQVEEWSAKGVTILYDGYIYIFTHV